MKSDWLETVIKFVDLLPVKESVPKKEVVTSLIAILESTTKAEKTVEDHSRKRYAKSFPVVADNLSGLHAKKVLASNLIYHLNKRYLRIFIWDPSNLFLVRHFARNDGLSKTDCKNSKPHCR